jgi:hypothetical protein
MITEIYIPMKMKHILRMNTVQKADWKGFQTIEAIHNHLKRKMIIEKKTTNGLIAITISQLIVLHLRYKKIRILGE